MTAGIPPQRILIVLSEFLNQVAVAATLEARTRACSFTMTNATAGVAVVADRDMLLSAVGNLLQNAFKFSRVGSTVSLIVRATDTQVFIDVSDRCGGLPPGVEQKMFLPFVQGGADKSGVGLGLPISKQCVEANGGLLTVRNIATLGCVFTIELPRYQNG